MDNFNKEEIINHAREHGWWLQRDVQMDRKQFMEFCNHIATPWSWKIHDMHGEGDLNEEEVVDWSSETRFMKRSLPWHADNPWSKDFQFPLRAFYAVNIPDPKERVKKNLEALSKTTAKDQFVSIANYFENKNQDYFGQEVKLELADINDLNRSVKVADVPQLEVETLS